jgi:HlyD family secretion protein
MRRYNWLGLVLVVVFSLLMVACTGPTDEEAAQAEAEAAAAAADFTPIVSATGEVMPVDKSSLSFPLAGQVVELLVEEGQTVSEGDVIARLDTTLLEARVAEAEAALAIAEANLERTKAGAREEEIVEAEHNIRADNADIAAAAANRDDIEQGATDAEVAQARVNVQQAYINEYFMHNNLDQVTGWAFDASPDEEVVEKEAHKPSPPGGTTEEFEMKVAQAEQRLIAAQEALDDLLDGPNENALAAAEAQVWAAAAERAAAEAALNLLKAGPQVEAIEVSKAQVEQSRAALEAAQLNLEHATLVAPFDGTVSTVFIRNQEFVSVGQAIVLLADLDDLHVETTDLNEIDVARVQVGDSVEVTFDALPGVVEEGTVDSIAPKASEGSGVNFTVIVKLDNMPPQVRWGMTAFVDIEVSE